MSDAWTTEPEHGIEDGDACTIAPNVGIDDIMAPRYFGPADGKDATLIGKLAAVTAAIDTVERSGYNDDREYRYATESDLYQAVRGPLAERGIMLLTAEVGRRRYDLRRIKTNGELQITPVLDVLVQFTFFDGESNERLTFHGVGSRPDYDGTAGAGAITGAIRSTLAKQFLIPLDDAEGSAERPERAPRSSSGGKSGVPKVPFGRSQGKTITTAAIADLQWIRPKLDVDDEKYGARNRVLVEAIDEEIKRRAANEPPPVATPLGDPDAPATEVGAA